MTSLDLFYERLILGFDVEIFRKIRDETSVDLFYDFKLKFWGKLEMLKVDPSKVDLDFEWIL